MSFDYRERFCSVLATSKRHIHSLRAPCSTRPGTYCARRPHCTHGQLALHLQETRVSPRRTLRPSYTMTCCGKRMATVRSSRAGLRTSAVVLRLTVTVRAACKNAGWRLAFAALLLRASLTASLRLEDDAAIAEPLQIPITAQMPTCMTAKTWMRPRRTRGRRGRSSAPCALILCPTCSA